MASIITSAFRILQAKQFQNAFAVSASNSVYLGISKPSEWANELIPDTPVDSGSYNVLDVREWMAAKRLNVSDTTLAIPRHNWATGTVYASYDDADATLFTKSFYIITDEYKIYKCISKPTPSTQSTSKPTATPTSGYVVTGDGYKWKYMMTLTAPIAARFLTDLWIPVNELLADDASASNQWQVQLNAVNGTIDAGVVVNGGSGYSSVGVTINGDGTGAVATATLSSGIVTDIVISNPGSNYTWATMTITGNGTNATARPIISPIEGHGSNIVSELGGFYVVVNAILNYDESGKFPKFNDYRKLFLVQSPTVFGTSDVAQDPVYTCVRKLTLASSTGDFVPDEVITGVTSGATAIVVEYDSGTKVISVISESKAFDANENVTGSISAVTGTNITLNTPPELNRSSGSIVYKDYRRYVDRQAGQSENIVVAVEF